MRFLKLLGKILLWITAIYVLTIINLLAIIKIIKPEPLISIIPILCLAILEAVLIYRLFKSRVAVRIEEVMGKKRSKGVTIFAWLNLIGAIISIPLILTHKIRLEEFQIAHFTLPNGYFYVTQSYNIVAAIACLMAGIGLLRLLNWARLLSMAMGVCGFAYSIFFYFYYTKPYIIPHVIQEGKPIFPFHIFYTIGLLFIIGIIYFFTRPKVKEQFK